MSILPTPTPAPTPKSKAVVQVSILYVVLLTAMAVGQLFAFKEFISLLESFSLPLSGWGIAVLAPILTASEVFAIPFLLRMSLSPAFRWFSMFLGLFTAIIWTFISIIVVTYHPTATTVGFLGAKVPLAPGGWAICFSIALLLLSLWAIWGLWPRRHTGK